MERKPAILDYTTPPTPKEILQLHRQSYCNAYMHWMQTRGYNPSNWVVPDGSSAKAKALETERLRADGFDARQFPGGFDTSKPIRLEFGPPRT